jgi:hypothetical protein
MKISIDIDAKPQELREFFGLPDIEPLQQEMLGQIREKMLGGAAGFDPTTLLKPYLPEQLRGAADWQQAIWDALRQATGQGAAADKADAKQQTDR